MLAQEKVDKFLYSDVSKEYKLDTYETILLLCLANRCGKNESCFPTQEYLMIYCRMSQTKLFRTTKSLLSKNLIQLEKKNRNYIYKLSIPILVPQTTIEEETKPDTSPTDYYLPQILVPQTTISPRYQSGGLPNISTKDNNSLKDNNSKEKRSKKRSLIEQSIIDIPSWIKKELWTEFLQHRKSMKSPMTELAQKKAFTALEKMKGQGQNIEEVINNSIVNGWKGLFPIKEYENGNAKFDGKSGKNGKEDFDAFRVLAELAGGETIYGTKITFSD